LRIRLISLVKVIKPHSPLFCRQATPTPIARRRRRRRLGRGHCARIGGLHDADSLCGASRTDRPPRDAPPQPAGRVAQAFPQRPKHGVWLTPLPTSSRLCLIRLRIDAGRLRSHRLCLICLCPMPVPCACASTPAGHRRSHRPTSPPRARGSGRVSVGRGMEDGAKAGADLGHKKRTGAMPVEDEISTFDRAAQYGCGNCPPAEHPISAL
jgi:hypothetical protein